MDQKLIPMVARVITLWQIIVMESNECHGTISPIPDILNMKDRHIVDGINGSPVPK